MTDEERAHVVMVRLRLLQGNGHVYPVHLRLWGRVIATEGWNETRVDGRLHDKTALQIWEDWLRDQ